MKHAITAIVMAGCALHMGSNGKSAHAGLPNQPDFGSNNISTDTHGCGCACGHCTGNEHVIADYS